MNQGKKRLVGAIIAAVELSIHAAVFQYDGGDLNNNLFSSPLNWTTDTVPAESIGTFEFSGNTAAPISDPAIIDLAFAQDITTMNVYHMAFPATEAFIEVPAGKTLSLSSPVLGQPGDSSFGGTLTIRTGGGITNPFLNGGATLISMDRYGVYGSSQYGAGMLVLENGANFRTAWLNLGTNGTIRLEFGTASAPGVAVSGDTRDVNVLDGTIQLDLASLATTGGIYTLIDGTGGALLTGGLKNWLDSQGGSFSATGTFTHANFEVLNGQGFVWNLGLANGNQDLVFTLPGTEPQELGVTLRDMNTMVSFSALPDTAGETGSFPIGTGGGESFLIDLAQTRNVDYVQLRKRLWLQQTPADLELAVYTGTSLVISEIAASTDWRTVSTLVNDGSNSDKSFSFPTESVQFLKATILNTLDGSILTEVGEIIVGSGSNVVTSDSDGDLVPDWDEMVAGTDPNNNTSFPTFEFGTQAGISEMLFSSSIGRLYAVQTKTNLLDEAWVSAGIRRAGTGNPLTVWDTNATDQVFYRLETVWP